MSVMRGIGNLRRLAPRATRLMSTNSDHTINVLSGIPDKHAARRVRIFRPAKVATQQGRGSITQMWKMTFEKIEGDDRWTNPLMGWTSTGDPLSNMGMAFPTKEAAIQYAERNGYGFTVVEPAQEKPHLKPIAPFKRAMVHHWRHSGTPVYEGDTSN
ncbi:NADH dehydrogenase [ubiquinone] iron-sulfur protein 4, mitochondrial [Gracilariopsis chorda]|uniref:NADH dehydrogenase [ubiquinone] iron-sulfur protein 4, mitochondrial n=1 Tax=Gracilariopsis chorda TaxID=448386 RepID=A0A2V3IXI8_9FLOR|nr:NADH dehydrogenase [ubiquinone] iron-sulfur protein 4, mitochondrial [Gracilariopsis chorda]|eukprot:PXF46858.1 NADH dehydrogenase [ubiquinone] iron-sulfur protein 4, mitochondrial [Gracilariopsis chorda]